MMKLKIYNALSGVFFPFGKLYAFIMQMRREKYKTSGKQFLASVPVVSVGNISWGGTGKTPIVEYLIEFANKNSLNPVVLTRGYGAKLKENPLLIKPEIHKASECGDEPLMLAHAKNISVLVDPQRVNSAKYAQAHLNPDLLILDDGFQHLKIKRDVDLVLLTKHDLDKGFNKVIPSGTWREPKSALADASAFLIKAKEDEWEEIRTKYYEKLFSYNKPLFAFGLEAIDIIAVNLEDTFQKNKDFVFITGIGKPEQALESVESYLGKEAKATKFYNDHHVFTESDVDYLESLKCQIVCTHKDAIKLKDLGLNNVYYLKVEAYFHSAHGRYDNFDTWLEQEWKNIKK